MFLLQNLGIAKFGLIQIQILLECTNFPQLIPLSSSMSCFQVNAKCQFLEGIRYTAEAYVYKWNCQLRCSCQISRRLSRDNKIASASETSNIYDKTLGDVVVVSHHVMFRLCSVYVSSIFHLHSIIVLPAVELLYTLHQRSVYVLPALELLYRLTL